MDIAANSEISTMSWANQDHLDNFPYALLGNISFNKTTEKDNNIESKVSVSVYSSYSSKLLMAGAVCCILLSIFGTTGNLISIFALGRKKRLQNNPTTAFIVNLCVADMLFCGFSVPLTALTFFERGWNYGAPLCKIFAFVKYTNGIVSIFTVVAITMNRYILIVHPKFYHAVYSKTKTWVFIFCLWMFPVILISLPLFDVWGTLKYNPSVGYCGVMDLNGKSPRALIFGVVMLLPSFLFVACYMRIYCVVKRAVGKSRIRGNFESEITDESGRREYRVTSVNVYLRDKKEFRVLRIVLVIFVVYTVCTFPLALIKLFKKETELHVMNILAYLFFFTSSVINPVIYIIMSREYRIAYKELFLCNM